MRQALIYIYAKNMVIESSGILQRKHRDIEDNYRDNAEIRKKGCCQGDWNQTLVFNQATINRIWPMDLLYLA